MKAIAKTEPAPGVEFIEVIEPQVRPGSVKVKVTAASVCGTDLHIYDWDSWAASRIHPPRIIGHEFCGEVVEVGEGVETHKPGDFISSESHITCGKCRQCRAGQRHVCVNTKILGVDVDGGFAPFVVIPAENARLTSKSIPPRIAAFQDALGNAVHTVAAGPVEDQTLLITGMGPIGLFAVTVAKAMGAAKVIATEVSALRIDIAKQIGADVVVNPLKENVFGILDAEAPGGVDGVLEMSGRGSSLDLAVGAVRPGGRISLLGVYPEGRVGVDMDQVIFKGIELQGIVGRKLWETWDLMGQLLESGSLNLDPVITHVLPFEEFKKGMELLNSGQAGKVVFEF